MSTKAAAQSVSGGFSLAIVRNFIELTKPRILFMVVLTALLGFFLGGKGISDWGLLFYSLAGIALVVAGSCALNNYLEADVDALMHRTKNRALPSGRVSPSQVLYFGVLLILSGVLLLTLKVNLLTGFLGMLSAFLYVLAYTPMKRRTPFNTLIGAIPGALPPMGGWTAATGELGVGAWILFLIMFAWQQPHFYAIAWMYCEDYRRGGLKMLPVVEPDGKHTCREVIVYSLLLLPLTAFPAFIGMAGKVYLIGAILLSTYFFFSSLTFVEQKTTKSAKNLLKASVLYLPLLLILIIVDATF